MEEKVELQVSYRKLLIGLVVAVIPISFAGLYSMVQGYRSLEGTIGSHFKTLAGSAAAGVSDYVSDRVIDVALIASEPVIEQAVAASNRSYAGMQDAAIISRFQKIDQSWNTPAAEPIVKEMLSSPASRVLRRHHELDPRILRITVTDARGAAVAASHKTLDYYQADEEYWQNIYAQGRGAVSLTDVLYDEATQAHYIGVGIPIKEEGSDRFIGTVDALVDVSSLFPIINRAHVGSNGRTLLVKADGTVITGPDVNLAMKLKSEEFIPVRPFLDTFSAREKGYVVADVKGMGRTLIGFADTGLSSSYNKLGWVVLVSQTTTEALAPVRVVERLIGFVSLLGLATITVLIVYFVLHRKLQITEIGELRDQTQAEPEIGTKGSKEVSHA